MAAGDQLLEILVGGVDRDPAHGDVGALMLAALGERDAQRAARHFGIVEEQLVEIAHPVEQQTVRMGRLDVEVLRHHRRGACGGGRVVSRRGAGIHHRETTRWR